MQLRLINIVYKSGKSAQKLEEKYSIPSLMYQQNGQCTYTAIATAKSKQNSSQP